MFAYLPFICQTIFTIMLVNFLRARQKRIHVLFLNFQDKLSILRIKKVMGGAVIWCMMVTFPSATVKFFYSTLILTQSGQLILCITDLWIFTLHSMNFFLLLASNKFFRYEVMKIVKIVKKNRNK